MGAEAELPESSAGTGRAWPLLSQTEQEANGGNDPDDRKSENTKHKNQDDPNHGPGLPEGKGNRISVSIYT